ncbi:hypothetical protein [Pantoea sp. B9002]|uniref:hypothetical protein n=1 Tax=Pantoea sp. B9002 TaxID=2726979 RepID=UPI0021071943|nr:hypothetical protein [Pantoea sp. B9002]
MFKILVFLFLIVSGCSNNVVFHPDELPNGFVQKSYKVPVMITGGSGPVVDLIYEINPPGAGLTLQFEKKPYYTKYIYNKFTIEGEPLFVGDVYITIRGGLVGGAGKVFKKTYKLRVEN